MAFGAQAVVTELAVIIDNEAIIVVDAGKGIRSPVAVEAPWMREHRHHLVPRQEP